MSKKPITYFFWVSLCIHFAIKNILYVYDLKYTVFEKSELREKNTVIVSLTELPSVWLKFYNGDSSFLSNHFLGIFSTQTLKNQPKFSLSTFKWHEQCFGGTHIDSDLGNRLFKYVIGYHFYYTNINEKYYSNTMIFQIIAYEGNFWGKQIFSFDVIL